LVIIIVKNINRFNATLSLVIMLLMLLITKRYLVITLKLLLISKERKRERKRWLCFCQELLAITSVISLRGGAILSERFDNIIFDLKATAASRVDRSRFIAENAKRCPLRVSSGRMPQRVGDYGGAMDRTSGLSGKPASLCATHGRHGRTNSETRAIVHGRRYSRLVCETANPDALCRLTTLAQIDTMA